MYTTCLGLLVTSSSSSHSRDIPVPFWASVYTVTDYPALLSLSASSQWTAVCPPPHSPSLSLLLPPLSVSLSVCFIMVESSGRLSQLYFSVSKGFTFSVFFTTVDGIWSALLSLSLPLTAHPFQGGRPRGQLVNCYSCQDPPTFS